jgi:hypothetical protein
MANSAASNCAAVELCRHRPAVTSGPPTSNGVGSGAKACSSVVAVMIVFFPGPGPELGPCPATPEHTPQSLP